MKLKLVKFLPLLVTIMLLGFTSCNSHVVKTDTLNVRATPSKNGKVIGKLHRRDRIDVTPYNEKWGEIEFEDKKGYVATEYLCTTKEHFIDTLETIGIIAGIVVFLVGGGLVMSVLGGGSSSSSTSRSTSKTKSYYANKIAQEERILASWKASLATKKDDYSRRNLKASIERQKGLIASLKAEMKAAPKD
jgi:N-acetylmuramoyl-L-alanine amidase